MSSLSLSSPYLITTLNLELECKRQSKVNKCTQLIIPTVLFGKMIFTKCYFSKFQLPELLPGKGIGRCEVGGKANGFFWRLAELLGMQAFLRRLLMKLKIEISKNFFKERTLLGCYMGVNDGYIASNCLEKVFWLMGKENLLIGALRVKFTLLLVWDLTILLEVLCYVLGVKMGVQKADTILFLTIFEMVRQSHVQMFFWNY